MADKRIDQLTPKAVPVVGDYLVIADSEASNPTTGAPLTKKVEIGNLPSGSSFSTPENTVIVDSAATPETGKIYATWTAADAYVATQSPSATENWTIYITGINSENIIVRDHVHIIGTGDQPYLSGSITSTGGNYTDCGTIQNCYIKGLGLSANYLMLKNCTINTTINPSGGNLQINECTINGGDFTSLASFDCYNSQLLGGLFNATLNAYNCYLNSTSSNFAGGDFYSCTYTDNSSTIQAGYVYRFYNCHLDIPNITLNTSSSFKFYDCFIDDSVTFTVGAIPIAFETYNCGGEFTVTGAQAAQWSNTGGTYDNTTSGLTATNVQAAIDEVYAASGSSSRTVVSKAVGDSPYSASVGEDVLVDASGGAVIVNLPAASGNSGKSILVSKRDSSGYTVTVDGNASETINGSLTLVISSQYDSFELGCDGSNWYIR